MTFVRTYFVDNERSNLVNGIADKCCTQDQVAEMYCDLMIAISLDALRVLFSWRTINQAIIDRWSISGLVCIKRMAWKKYRAECK